MFAYGFEDLTAAEWSLLEALAGRAEVDVSLPYEPGRAAFASLARTAEDLAALADGRDRASCRRARPSTPRPALAHLERALFEPGRRPPPPIGGAVRFLEGAGTRGTLELVADELLALLRDGVAGRADRARRPVARALARAARDRVRHGSASRTRSRRRVRLAGDAARPRAALAAALRLGGRRPARALRVPALAVLGHRALERRLRRGPAARPRRRRAGARRGGDRAAARGAARRRCASCATPRRRSTACARCSPRCSRSAYGLEAPPAGDTSRLDLRCVARGDEAARRARRAGSALGEPLGAGRADRRARARSRCGRRRRGEPGRVAVLDLLRARTRRFDAVFVLGLEEGSLPRRGAQLAVPRRRPPPRARRAGSSGPTRSAATATSSTRPARARRGASTSSARRRPTTARRASRARSGTTSRPSSTRTTSQRATRAARALAADAGRSTTAPTERERLRALARLSADAESDATSRSRSPTRTAGRGASRRARRAFERRHAAPQPGRARAARRRARRSARPSSSASSTARRPGSSSGWSTRRRSTPRPTRCCAARSRTRRSTRSTSGLPKELGADRVTPRDARAGARASSSAASTTRCARGVRLELGDVAAAELREGLLARPRALRPRARRASTLGASCRAGSRSASAPTARRPSCSAGSSSATGSSSAARSTGSTSTRSARAGSCRTTSRARARSRRGRSTTSGGSRCRSTCSCCATSSGSSRSAASTARSRAPRGARGMLRAEARDDLPGFKPARLPRRGRVLGRRSRRRASARATRRAGSAPATSRTTRKGGECPTWCDLWTMCRVARGLMNEQQLAAVEARGEVFVSAGAGTGKTAVLVERFVRAVCDEGLDVESVLVITYTRKAAGRAARRASARRCSRAAATTSRGELDGAWISTIHGFCARLLRAHPFAVGIDPRFRELDEEHGAVLRGEAFDRALEAFCATRRARAAPPARDLRQRRGCGRCSPASTRRCARPAGRSCSSSASRPTSAPRLDGAARGGASACSTIAARDRGPARRGARRARPPVDCPSGCSTWRRCARAGARAASFEEARKAVEQAALEHRRRRATASCSRSCSTCSPPSTRPAKERESALDFEDLQLLARDLLAGDERVREAEQLRFRAIMVDEFQDTNALQCDADRPARRRPARRTSSTSATSSSRSTAFRHADVDVFRERRAAAAQRLPLTRELPLAARGARGGQPPLRPGVRRRLPAARRRRASSPTRSSAIRSSCSSPTRRRTAARGEHWRRAEARHVARRVRELVDAGAATPGRDRPAVRGRHGRRVVRGGAARARAADLPRDGPALLRPAAGRRPAHVPAAAAQPLRRRGARRRARLAVRRRLERRARADPPPRRPPAALHRDRALAARRRSTSDDERLVRAFKQRYERLVAASARVSLERLCELVVSRARLRPRGARALGRPAPLREPAQADAARALLRGAARPRHRGLRPLHPRPGGARRRAARGRVGGGGRRRGAAADDPRREGARVQGRRRRRRGTRHRRRRRRPTRSSRSPTAASASRSSTRRRASARRCSSYDEVRRRRAARPPAPSGCASTTSR